MLLKEPVDPKPVVEHVHDRQPRQQPGLQIQIGDIHRHILPGR